MVAVNPQDGYIPNLGDEIVSVATSPTFAC